MNFKDLSPRLQRRNSYLGCPNWERPSLDCVRWESRLSLYIGRLIHPHACGLDETIKNQRYGKKEIPILHTYVKRSRESSD